MTSLVAVFTDPTLLKILIVAVPVVIFVPVFAFWIPQGSPVLLARDTEDRLTVTFEGSN